jgi:hypothetical protein
MPIDRSNNRNDKSISTPRNGLDEPGVIRIVVQGLPQLRYRCTQALAEFNKRISRPKTLLENFAAHNLARILKKKQEQLERLLLQFDAVAMAKKFSRLRMDFEDAEAVDEYVIRRASHAVRTGSVSRPPPSPTRR